MPVDVMADRETGDVVGDRDARGRLARTSTTLREVNMSRRVRVVSDLLVDSLSG
jgi:hypothetical protein